MGVVAFRDLASSAKKLADRGAQASGDYTKNAVAAANDWHANTSAAGDLWKAGVQDAMSRDAFKKSVDAAGPGAYSSQVQAVGGTRFSDGMTKAGPKWSAGFGKVAQLVQGKDLGPRGLPGSAQNKARSAAMVDAWRAAKLQVNG